MRSQLAYPTSFAFDLLNLTFGLIEFLELFIIFHNVPRLADLDWRQALLVMTLARTAFTVADLVVGHVDQMPVYLPEGHPGDGPRQAVTRSGPGGHQRHQPAPDHLRPVRRGRRRPVLAHRGRRGRQRVHLRRRVSRSVSVHDLSLAEPNTEDVVRRLDLSGT
jgi:hypothetical protein